MRDAQGHAPSVGLLLGVRKDSNPRTVGTAKAHVPPQAREPTLPA